MAKAIYPGSFDPVHNGHLDIAIRASKLFEKLTVAVYDNPLKNLMFNTDQRIDMFAKSVLNYKNIEVVPFTELAPDFARKKKAEFIIRGLRAGFDFEQEFEMALMWRNLAPDIDVVCMMSSLSYQFLFSSRIKEVAKLGGKIDNLVPELVLKNINKKINNWNN